MKTKEKVDMHIHTMASDGTWDVQQLLTEILSKNIGIFSITDHDCLDNNHEMTQLTKLYEGLKFIPGVEVSSIFKGRICHVLGYGIDFLNNNLITFLQESQKLQIDDNAKTIELLETKFPNISLYEYTNYKSPKNRGGWKSLNYLMDKNFCKNHKEYFRALKDLECSNEKTFFPHIKNAIEIIMEAGGIPVLAHPGVSLINFDFKDCIDEILDLGIKGFECFHPDNSLEIQNFLLEFCNNKKLLITGGSDCHGEFIKSRKVGVPEIYLEDLFLDDLLKKSFVK